jgi:carboxymethylenebutenolidase
MNPQLNRSGVAAAQNDVTRREFVGASLATGLAGIGGGAVAAGMAVVESDVTIKTADGVCDAAFFHPASGAHPGVLFWTDAFGLRPAMRDMAKRLSAEGYTVLLPNPFYRVVKAPVVETAAHFDFQDKTAFDKLRPLMGSVNAAGAAERDAAAYVAYLDAQAPVDRSKKIGSQGSCMGGALVVRTAAAMAERVGVGASFHSGGLVSDKPDSPHRLAPKIKASMYFGIAANDDQKQPDAKDQLAQAFADAKRPATVEVYPARHGWYVPDMPVEAGPPIYSAPDAERAWAKLLVLYRGALV